MLKQDYEQMKRELRRDYEEKLAALDKVWLVFGPKKLVAPNGASTGTSKEWTHNVSKREAVREAVKQIQGEFNIHNVRETLKHTRPEISQDIEDNQLSAIVSYMKSQGEVEQVKAKSGKSPAVYKNKLK